MTTNDSIPINEFNFTHPSSQLQSAYQISAGLFGILDSYIFIALIVYEIFIQDKPKNGNKLRLLCVLATSSAVLHQILQQFIVYSSGTNNALCSGLMATKSTLINAIVSFTYSFLWLRQRLFYSNPQLPRLRGKWMDTATWFVLGLLIINPCIMLGFQFNGELYKAIDGTCLVLHHEWHKLLPFILVAFSYTIIQITLVFLYFYPLYNRNISHTSPTAMMPRDYRTKSICASLDANSKALQGEEILSQDNLNTVHVVSKAPSINTISIPPSKTQVEKRKRSPTNIRSLEARMKRGVILSCVCIVSDLVTATTIAVFLLSSTPASVISGLFMWHDISMFLNVVCVIGCFSDFCVMLFPFGTLLKNEP